MKSKEQRQKILMLLAYLELESPSKTFHFNDLFCDALGIRSIRLTSDLAEEHLGITHDDGEWSPMDVMFTELFHEEIPVRQIIDILRWVLN